MYPSMINKGLIVFLICVLWNPSVWAQEPGGEVMGGEMGGGEIIGGEMGGSEIIGGEMGGNEIIGGAMGGNDMVGGEVMGGEMEGGEMMMDRPPFDDQIFLRYQGVLEGLDLADDTTIDCLFSLKNLDEEFIFSERNQDLKVYQNHFTITLGTSMERPLPIEQLDQPLWFVVQCDVDGDLNYDVDYQEAIGQTPRAAVAHSVKGPVDAVWVSINGQKVIDENGRWVGAPIIPTYDDIPVINEQGEWVGPAVNSENGQISNLTTLSLTTTTLDTESLTTQTLIATNSIESLSITSATLNSNQITSTTLNSNQIESQTITTTDLSTQNVNTQTVTTTSVNTASLVASTLQGDSITAQVQINTPLLQSNRVDLAELYFNSDPNDPQELINAEGRWVSDIESSHIDVDQIELQGTLVHQGQTVVNDQGQWIGEIAGTFVDADQDGDGIGNLQEFVLGTDAFDPASTPLDQDQNGTADAFQFNPSLVDFDFDADTLSRTFTLHYEATVFNEDPQTIEEWQASTIEIVESGTITDVSLILDFTYGALNYQDLALYLESPSGTRIALTEVGDPTLAREFSSTLQPPNQDWDQLIGESIQGTWSIYAQDDIAEGRLGFVDVFELNFTYQAADRIALNRNIDLQNQYGIYGAQVPTEPDQLSSKEYVDQQVSTLRDSRFFPSRFTYRWGVFSLYDEGRGEYLFPDELASLFGGVAPSSFSGNNVRSADLDLERLDGLLTQEAQGGSDTLLVQKNFASQDTEQQGHFLLFHFQVRNVSDQDVTWDLDFLSSCNEQINQRSSLAVDGQNVWNSTNNRNCNPTRIYQASLTFSPKDEPYDLLGLISASLHNSGQRQLIFAFINQSLTLPEGLEWVASWR